MSAFWLHKTYCCFQVVKLFGKKTKNKTKRQRIPKEQSKMDNPEKLATQGTQDEEKQNNNTTQYVLDTTIRKQTQIT